jgi:DNA modification methylase
LGFRVASVEILTVGQLLASTQSPVLRQAPGFFYWSSPLQIEMMPTERLVPYARNARTHSDQQVAQIAASIVEFGFTNPILIGDDDVIIAGHGRLMAAQHLGLAEVPTIVLAHLNEAQRRALVVADNKIALNAGWDTEILLEQIELSRADGFDLDLLGFSDEELEGMLEDIEAPQLGDAVEGEDDVPEPPAEPVSVLGDLWVLGNHRLLCGDSTLATDVERVLGGVKPLLMVTDPPYGVEYDPRWRNQAGAASTKRTGKVLNDDRADWREAWALFPGDVAYVWHGALHATTVAESLIDTGFNIRSQIIWAKDRLILSRGDYHWQHEPCWYAVRKKGKGHWAGDRKQTTLWHIANKDQDAETVHGTQKPVECMRRPILNNSSQGQAVYEPFMGSGTTLIAAETTGRVCYGIELNPAYIDVIVARWQNLTGKEATLDGDGSTFLEVMSERLGGAAIRIEEKPQTAKRKRKPAA